MSVWVRVRSFLQVKMICYEIWMRLPSLSSTVEKSKSDRLKMLSLIIIILQISKWNRNRFFVLEYILFAMQQTDTLLGHLQFFSHNFFQILHRIVVFDGDRKWSTGRCVDIQCNWWLIKFCATPKMLVNVLRIAAHFSYVCCLVFLYVLSKLAAAFQLIMYAASVCSVVFISNTRKGRGLLYPICLCKRQLSSSHHQYGYERTALAVDWLCACQVSGHCLPVTFGYVLLCPQNGQNAWVRLKAVAGAEVKSKVHNQESKLHSPNQSIVGYVCCGQRHKVHSQFSTLGWHSFSFSLSFCLLTNRCVYLLYIRHNSQLLVITCRCNATIACVVWRWSERTRSCVTGYRQLCVCSFHYVKIHWLAQNRLMTLLAGCCRCCLLLFFFSLACTRSLRIQIYSCAWNDNFIRLRLWIMTAMCLHARVSYSCCYCCLAFALPCLCLMRVQTSCSK